MWRVLHITCCLIFATYQLLPITSDILYPPPTSHYMYNLSVIYICFRSWFLRCAKLICTLCSKHLCANNTICIENVRECVWWKTEVFKNTHWNCLENSTKIFPISYSLFPIPYSLHAHSLFPITYSLFTIPFSLFTIPYCLFPFIFTTDSEQ